MNPFEELAETLLDGCAYDTEEIITSLTEALEHYKAEVNE